MTSHLFPWPTVASARYNLHYQRSQACCDTEDVALDVREARRRFSGPRSLTWLLAVAWTWHPAERLSVAAGAAAPPARSSTGANPRGVSELTLPVTRLFTRGSRNESAMHLLVSAVIKRYKSKSLLCSLYLGGLLKTLSITFQK